LDNAPQSTFRARYQAGLNDFEYCASLHLEHSALDPAVITQALHLEPEHSHFAGEPRRTPKGRSREGVYPSGYWFAKLEVVDGENLEQFLWRVLQRVEPIRELLASITNDNGNAECFVGLFATGLCDQSLSAKLLVEFGQRGIDLRLDYYPSKAKDDSREE